MDIKIVRNKSNQTANDHDCIKNTSKSRKYKDK